MKPVMLGLGLFVVFLLARNTFKMSAQGPSALPETKQIVSADARSRRAAALEAQEQSLAMRQQQIENYLDQTSDSLRRVTNRIERTDATNPDEQAQLRDLAALQAQLEQKKLETDQELEKVVQERHRVQEDWSALTGLRPGSR